MPYYGVYDIIIASLLLGGSFRSCFGEERGISTEA